MRKITETLRLHFECGRLPPGYFPRHQHVADHGLRLIFAAPRQLLSYPLSAGNFGDCKPLGEGVSELRVDIGTGYRVYYGKHGQSLIILLCGGDKGSQPADITRAKAYWANWKRRNS